MPKQDQVVFDAIIETCGDPSCVACRVRVVTSIMVSLEKQAPPANGVSTTRAATYDLMLCAAFLAQESECMGESEFTEAARAGFKAGEDFRRMIAVIEAEGRTKQ